MPVLCIPHSNPIFPFPGGVLPHPGRPVLLRLRPGGLHRPRARPADAQHRVLPAARPAPGLPDAPLLLAQVHLRRAARPGLAAAHQRAQAGGRTHTQGRRKKNDL